MAPARSCLLSNPGNNHLCESLHTQVDLQRQWISQIVEEVQKVVHHLTTEISRQDIRFQAVPYSDTYSENIKVLAPSQFLITVPVKGLAREWRWRHYTLQGARLSYPLRDPKGLQQWLQVEQFMRSLWQWHQADVNIKGDIVPTKVLHVFQKLVDDVIGICHLSVVRVCLAGCYSYHWQLSFLRAEQVLLEQLDEDGGCRRRCFQAMRQMKEDVWCPGKRPVITSHHLQTVLFWTCEKYPRLKDWQIFNKAFLCLVRKLHKCVSQHFLKHYFVRKSNLLPYANSDARILPRRKATCSRGNYIHTVIFKGGKLCFKMSESGLPGTKQASLATSFGDGSHQAPASHRF
ncbi:protein mab-21-like 3 [Manis pentadactyla]|uniref:protein mab-21-like 3 n=1 Tax=Manis pentadactyla TaxID=143292 RepID=UPI00255C3A61|nr:protein mab-21-like 3 [Manis pentadactyla]